MPRFPTTICDRNLDLAFEYLASLKYTGPVGMSCDDTKLHPALRTYWDPSKECHFLVGTIGEPIAVKDETTVRELMETHKKNAATKVSLVTCIILSNSSDFLLQIRVWTLQIPLPGISPLVLAAKAIPNSLTAPQLLPLSFDLIKGLISRKIKVISYSCDGSEVERSVQKQIVEKADYKYTYRIRHPIDGQPPIITTIAVIDGQPVAMVQDSNHGLKTSRNNLFTGAKLLTIGGHVAMFQYARQVAFESGSPLYHRDVEKLDRQDDNAAIRVHSGSHIAYLAKNHPQLLGHIIYLFINGELIDAYQNRNIPHLERIKMVLRAKFFYQMWRSFLKAAGYAEDRHFVSHQFADIIDILIDGLISLVIIYRDHMDGEIFPLLLWLHSSEICEHLFAECRKLIKDFTYLDFIYMVPHLLILIRAAVNLGHSGDSKARASGYTHSWHDSEDINITNLSDLPLDSDIERVAKEAWDEADSLFTFSGVSPADFIFKQQEQTTRLPGIGSWFTPDTDPIPELLHPEEEDDGFVAEADEELDSEEISEATQLQSRIDDEEFAHSRSNETDNRMLGLTCAAIAVEVDEHILV